MMLFRHRFLSFILALLIALEPFATRLYALAPATQLRADIFKGRELQLKDGELFWAGGGKKGSSKPLPQDAPYLPLLRKLWELGYLEAPAFFPPGSDHNENVAQVVSLLFQKGWSPLDKEFFHSLVSHLKKKIGRNSDWFAALVGELDAKEKELNEWIESAWSELKKGKDPIETMEFIREMSGLDAASRRRAEAVLNYLQAARTAFGMGEAQEKPVVREPKPAKTKEAIEQEAATHNLFDREMDRLPLVLQELFGEMPSDELEPLRRQIAAGRVSKTPLLSAAAAQETFWNLFRRTLPETIAEDSKINESLARLLIHLKIFYKDKKIANPRPEDRAAFFEVLYHLWALQRQAAPHLSSHFEAASRALRDFMTAGWGKTHFNLELYRRDVLARFEERNWIPFLECFSGSPKEFRLLIKKLYGNDLDLAAVILNEVFSMNEITRLHPRFKPRPKQKGGGGRGHIPGRTRRPSPNVDKLIAAQLKRMEEIAGMFEDGEFKEDSEVFRVFFEIAKNYFYSFYSRSEKRALRVLRAKIRAERSSQRRAMQLVYQKVLDHYLELSSRSYPQLRVPLDPYQKVGVEFCLTHDSALLADDMGLGKTRQILAALVAGDKQRALIVAPKTVLSGWKSKIEKYLGREIYEKLLLVENPKDLEKLGENRFALINYEKVASPKYRKKLIEWNPDVVVLDEAHKIRNPKKKRPAAPDPESPVAPEEKPGDQEEVRLNQAYAALKLSEKLPGAQKIASTGTPVVNAKVTEIWPLLKFLCPVNPPGPTPEEIAIRDRKLIGVPDLVTFRKRYGTTEGKRALNDALTEIMLRRKKEDVLAGVLPEKRVRIEEVELQGRHYEIYEAKERDRDQSPLAYYQKLRKYVLDPAIRTEADPGESLPDGEMPVKYEKVRELAWRAWEEGRKIVIFTYHREAAKKIRRLLIELKKEFLARENPADKENRLNEFRSQYRANLEDLHDDAEIKKYAKLFQKRGARQSAVEKHLEENSFGVEILQEEDDIAMRFLRCKNFRENPLCDTEVSTLGVGGEGIDLQGKEPRTMIFLEFPWVPGERAQAIDRVYRHGQEGDVDVVQIVAQGTEIDEKFITFLREKGITFDQIVDGKFEIEGEEDPTHAVLDRMHKEAAKRQKRKIKQELEGAAVAKTSLDPTARRMLDWLRRELPPFARHPLQQEAEIRLTEALETGERPLRYDQTLYVSAALIRECARHFDPRDEEKKKEILYFLGGLLQAQSLDARRPSPFLSKTFFQEVAFLLNLGVFWDRPDVNVLWIKRLGADRSFLSRLLDLARRLPADFPGRARHIAEYVIAENREIYGDVKKDYGLEDDDALQSKVEEIFLNEIVGALEQGVDWAAQLEDEGEEMSPAKKGELLQWLYRQRLLGRIKKTGIAPELTPEREAIRLLSDLSQVGDDSRQLSGEKWERLNALSELLFNNEEDGAEQRALWKRKIEQRESADLWGFLVGAEGVRRVPEYLSIRQQGSSLWGDDPLFDALLSEAILPQRLLRESPPKGLDTPERIVSREELIRFVEERRGTPYEVKQLIVHLDFRPAGRVGSEEWAQDRILNLRKGEARTRIEQQLHEERLMEHGQIDLLSPGGKELVRELQEKGVSIVGLTSRADPKCVQRILQSMELELPLIRAAGEKTSDLHHSLRQHLRNQNEKGYILYLDRDEERAQYLLDRLHRHRFRAAQWKAEVPYPPFEEYDSLAQKAFGAGDYPTAVEWWINELDAAAVRGDAVSVFRQTGERLRRFAKEKAPFNAADLLEAYLVSVSEYFYARQLSKMEYSAEERELLRQYFGFFAVNPLLAEEYFVRGRLRLSQSTPQNRKKGHAFGFQINQENAYLFLEPLLNWICREKPDHLILIDTGARPFLPLLRFFIEKHRLPTRIKLLPASVHTAFDSKETLGRLLAKAKKMSENPHDAEFLIWDEKTQRDVERLGELFPLEGKIAVLDDNVVSGRTLDLCQKVFGELGIAKENIFSLTPFASNRGALSRCAAATMGLNFEAPTLKESWLRSRSILHIIPRWEGSTSRHLIGVHKRKPGETFPLPYDAIPAQSEEKREFDGAMIENFRRDLETFFGPNKTFAPLLAFSARGKAADDDEKERMTVEIRRRPKKERWEIFKFELGTGMSPQMLYSLLAPMAAAIDGDPLFQREMKPEIERKWNDSDLDLQLEAARELYVRVINARLRGKKFPSGTAREEAWREDPAVEPLRQLIQKETEWKKKRKIKIVVLPQEPAEETIRLENGNRQKEQWNYPDFHEWVLKEENKEVVARLRWVESSGEFRGLKRKVFLINEFVVERGVGIRTQELLECFMEELKKRLPEMGFDMAAASVSSRFFSGDPEMREAYDRLFLFRKRYERETPLNLLEVETLLEEHRASKEDPQRRGEIFERVRRRLEVIENGGIQSRHFHKTYLRERFQYSRSRTFSEEWIKLLNLRFNVFERGEYRILWNRATAGQLEEAKPVLEIVAFLKQVVADPKQQELLRDIENHLAEGILLSRRRIYFLNRVLGEHYGPLKTSFEKFTKGTAEKRVVELAKKLIRNKGLIGEEDQRDFESIGGIRALKAVGASPMELSLSVPLNKVHRKKVPRSREFQVFEDKVFLESSVDLSGYFQKQGESGPAPLFQPGEEILLVPTTGLKYLVFHRFDGRPWRAVPHLRIGIDPRLYENFLIDARDERDSAIPVLRYFAAFWEQDGAEAENILRELNGDAKKGGVGEVGAIEIAI